MLLCRMTMQSFVHTRLNHNIYSQIATAHPKRDAYPKDYQIESPDIP